ncbi:MAG TPA: 2Fe-2S iron-sulfur cluster-binding protein, partial [Peptostreptococcaceae bacterium]|nr:2Fe-2S iron-sulfur cluster-binding protein [Peptostreptococcaceae bacterium]
MYKFILNRREVNASEDKNLLHFLREDENLTSVKNGCAEGACGTCTVLVDGRNMKACVLKTSKLVGKEIITIDGLSQRELDIYAYSFTNAGAVQCGFC